MVSFIMANYNGEQIIAETIDGVLNLNFDHNKLQLIIVDDCSTDQSINLIKSQYANHLGKLIHLIENKQNQGVAKSYNTGIQAALDNSESEYIFKIDNDLVMHADASANMHAEASAHAHADASAHSHACRCICKHAC